MDVSISDGGPNGAYFKGILLQLHVFTWLV